MTLFCPRCNSLLVVRYQATGLMDKLLALCALVSFQCQSCQHRFRAMQPRTSDTKREAERRTIARTPVQVPVKFEYGDDGGEGTLTDLSKDGCTLDSKRRLRPGLLLRVHLPAGQTDAPQTLVTQIASVRSVEGNRAGLKFLAFTPPEQVQLEQTVTSTLKRFTAKTAGPTQH
jgi:DNA-directed RNA polymerase subunit M/transcription elongation factor TFIIS